MDKFEAALCNYCIPGKENKEQCFIDFDKGRITAAQNYADALDEIKRLKARIAELEAENKKAFDFVRKLRMYCIFANWDNPDTEDEFDEFDAEICKWLRDFMEPDK